jgi:hypothetical protein
MKKKLADAGMLLVLLLGVLAWVALILRGLYYFLRWP